jgi:cellulose synthase/poly-beta-1,6-N-acetylglucosamine synthase-like glycosyltransferase
MIETIINSLNHINTFYFTILVFFGLFGLFPYKRKYKMIEDKNKFIIFVPSHNESSIISSTIENLSSIEYSKKLFKVYILADNCKDDTAKRARETISSKNLENFHVLERHDKDPLKRGKPHAIRWAINLLEEKQQFYKPYDLFLILDADNFVNGDILKNFNSHYESFSDPKKPVMIQCYLDCKNTKGVIAKGYHVSFRIVNRFSQLGRSRLGLNAMIGGTGFIINLKFLSDIGGFKAQSLTEDLEMQTIATMMNHRIAYNHYIRVYDEKPTSLRASFIQKTRWAQGHWWNFFHYGPRIFISTIKHVFNFPNFARLLDTLINLSVMINYVALFLNLMSTLISFLINYSFQYPFLQFWNLMLFLISLFIFYPIAFIEDGTKSEKKSLFIYWIPNYLSFMYSSYVYLFSALTGLFKFTNQHHWAKTSHTVNDIEKR